MMVNYIVSGLVILNLLSCDNKEAPKSTGVQNIRFEVFAEGLEVPWTIVFTNNDRVLVNERPGRLRVILKGKLALEPLHLFSDISKGGEEGLMGLALDPDYNINSLIYISYAYESENDLFIKVVKYKDNSTNLTEPVTLIDKIPAQKYHAGCRLRFGPDKMLYITTGDAGDRDFAQDLNKLNGKILRIKSDGTIPVDNPIPDSPIWTYGHRNPQGIDWYPGSEIMWETEHGPSGFDGPGGGDEVNIIVKGKNYGWPIVSHENSKEGMISPLLVFTPAEAPASGVFIKSDKFPGFKNCFLFGCLRGNGIIKVIIDENDKTKVKSYDKFATNFGRIRDITEGPDGYIYFSTSNRDGRGKPHEGDDKIYRIIPN